MVYLRNLGAFCETYGISIRNLVLEFILENQDIDFAIGDMAKELRISRPKAYQVISCFEKEGIVEKGRVVGRTQLYGINIKNPKVKLYRKHFKECLMLIAKEKENNPLIKAKIPVSSS
jgi:CTP-dependent riboflavin kinase